MKENSKNIIIKGARVNNLKNVDVEIPRGKFVVITGLSGSGKSSLAFDTLYAEGQRRYVESLSSYARQFLGQMNKPECDFIKGIPPAIAIEQKVNNRNPRSTVGTSTEIYEYLKLLYARIGKTYSPVSGRLVKKDTPEDLVTCMLSRPAGTRFLLLAPIPKRKGRTLEEQLQIYLQQGFTRVVLGKEIVHIEEYTPKKGDKPTLLIDRLAVNDSKEAIGRLSTESLGFAKSVCWSVFHFSVLTISQSKRGIRVRHPATYHNRTLFLTLFFRPHRLVPYASAGLRFARERLTGLAS